MITSSSRAIAKSAAYASVALIKFYRYMVSPILPNSCRFTPSCSEYAEQAITTHGLWYGLLITTRRLLKCHPWHIGGVDPVPPLSNPKRHYHRGQ